MKSNYWIVLFGFAVQSVNCQSIVPIPDNIREEIQTRVDSGLNPSIAIAAYENGDSDFYVYGMQNISAGIAATEGTIYDYGSVTKTFSSLLMAKYFVQQKLNIWDPIDKYLPQDLGLRQADGTPIELLHLVTHSSGMPKNADNWHGLHPENYGREELYEFLESYEPVNVGLTFSYSNAGFGTLGDALSYVADDGRGTKQLIEEEVIAPLGLSISYTLNSEEDEENFAQGYE